MQLERIREVQASYFAAAGDPEAFSAVFYARLFERHPEVRELFPGDMRPQHAKFGDMMIHVVTALARMEGARAELRAMGARHIDYGTVPAHYDAVGEALIWTLDQLHPDFTPRLRAAWIETYAMIVAPMLEGAAAAGD